eukprot:CAMPEP_0206265818 /NCGR_PEP_ID=MMETSP0047_2-20121206/30223_1 /ASSEMBLY_ACC=CAM_ASM_000192 /TAXON_ID=195065 /ORGANISM="Chroomonas mesostigmatica_cf, Strain CCMP1168" /LENGTH=160 /DNA_ID=CAMNT_0053693789 /DNA_START=23 /DNA_END=502 /DNA_ORIENTATION=+
MAATTAHIRTLASRLDAATAAAAATQAISPGVFKNRSHTHDRSHAHDRSHVYDRSHAHTDEAGGAGTPPTARGEENSGAVWKRLEGVWDAVTETQEAVKGLKREIDKIGRSAREWGGMQADVDRLTSKVDGYFGVWTEESEGVSAQLRDLWKELLSVRKT